MEVRAPPATSLTARPNRWWAASTSVTIAVHVRVDSSFNSNQSSPTSGKLSGAPPVSFDSICPTQYAWCSAISAMLWRPFAGRVNAVAGVTSAMAARRSAPYQAPVP